MKYACRPGVIKEKICGVYLLIPTRESFEACPKVVQLALPGAMAWELLREGKPMEDIYKVFRLLTKKTDEEVYSNVAKFLSSLVQAGALIETN